mmetsp:Transcript_15823/g.42683  ORF Transcript_15823/g.42683 Transcript_15823/m.42683 type:complete len:371 (+) Transcript_15823:553-1665(+)
MPRVSSPRSLSRRVGVTSSVCRTSRTMARRRQMMPSMSPMMIRKRRRRRPGAAPVRRRLLARSALHGSVRNLRSIALATSHRQENPRALHRSTSSCMRLCRRSSISTTCTHACASSMASSRTSNPLPIMASVTSTSSCAPSGLLTQRLSLSLCFRRSSSASTSSPRMAAASSSSRVANFWAHWLSFRQQSVCRWTSKFSTTPRQSRFAGSWSSLHTSSSSSTTCVCWRLCCRTRRSLVWRRGLGRHTCQRVGTRSHQRSTTSCTLLHLPRSFSRDSMTLCVRSRRGRPVHMTRLSATAHRRAHAPRPAHPRVASRSSRTGLLPGQQRHSRTPSMCSLGSWLLLWQQCLLPCGSSSSLAPLLMLQSVSRPW